MQVDRRFPETNDEQVESIYTQSAPTRASVWIDPIEQRNVSTSYIEHTQGELRRRKRVVGNPVNPINPVTPLPSTPIPPRTSAYPSGSLSARHRSLRTYTLPAPPQEVCADLPTLPPPGAHRAEHVNSLHSEGALPLRSHLHPESTVSRPKNASLSPQRAIDELTMVPLPSSITHIEQAIDEIDTILPVSPSIDELDTLPHVSESSSTSVIRTCNHRIASLHENEVDIDEIDTLAPGTITVLPPKPVHPQRRYTETQVTIVDSRPPVVSTSSIRQRGLDVSWTAGAGTNSELAKRIASHARDRQGKPLGELVLAPLSGMRWWLLYPGRMEFMLWISGALMLLGVTCTLLFATLASSGLIRFGATNTIAHVTGKSSSSSSCTHPLSHCHGVSTVATVVSHPTGTQAGPSTLKPAQGSSAPTTPETAGTPGVLNTPVSSDPSTPVSQTPVPASPTVSVSPTIEPTRTTPTPTPTKTMTPSPTVGITPTIGTTPPAKKPTVTTTHHTDTQTLSLGTAISDNNPTQRVTVNTWMWLVLIGYAFSMVLLGLAVLLYRRKHRTS